MSKVSKSTRKLRGQAAVEYVLVVAFMTLIFGAMFSQIRKNLFRLWVCELGPRIESPTGCRDTASCWGQLGPGSKPGQCSQ